MQTLQDGKYKRNSFRGDGSKYHSLLKAVGTYKDEELIINEDVLKNIDSFYYNLISTVPPKFMPESMDIIFIRNVFIYFTPEVRQQILKRLSTILKPSGLMFLSINEIVTIDNTEDLQLKKEHTGSIYYLKKIDNTEHKKKPAVIQIKSEPQETVKKEEKTASDADKDIKDLYKAITKSLNSHDSTAAWCLLQSQYFAPHTMEFMYYFAGLIYLEENEPVQAEEAFGKAMILNKEFWPATFQLGMIQKKNGKESESIKTFKVCAKTLNSYVKSNNMCYNAFTGSFSPEYFLVLCNNFINGV